ncbi:hypothetical protein G6011_01900 [Alternaria panax]|uniref:Uncharacterized protein n=1 Tax=Alternaria panax TaxID=48097 RepID=A0AAD4I712_9PLEO|nr:hypothetical protein G6011_01900 [Alternaria panax]
MTASHTLTLQELRFDIITTSMKSIYLEGKALVPDCWINGFGHVVHVEDVHDDAGEAWKFASDLDGQRVLALRPLDHYYRDNSTHADCIHEIGQFFPFKRQANEVIPYLLKHINQTAPQHMKAPD